MKTQIATCVLAALMGIGTLALPGTANAAIVFTNLGGSAPPPVALGSYTMTPFATAPQIAIAEYATVSAIPGNPFAGQLGVAPGVSKYTATQSWGTDPWPGTFAGPIYFSGFSVSVRTLTLPANTHAFYLYVQNNSDGNPMDTITVTTDSGATSGPVLVQTGFWAPNVGANGFAFHSTAGESIASITVQTDNSSGFAMGEFGISVGQAVTTTCASEGYKGAQLTWCQNICENGLTGQVLDTWIHRWIQRYRDLPYCAMGEEQQPK